MKYSEANFKKRVLGQIRVKSSKTNYFAPELLFMNIIKFFVYNYVVGETTVNIVISVFFIC